MRGGKKTKKVPFLYGTVKTDVEDMKAVTPSKLSKDFTEFGVQISIEPFQTVHIAHGKTKGK